MSSFTRPAYEGSGRKIVLAFDVGTTYSGISYSLLEPGECPTIHAVTRFPDQSMIAGASKVPSIIYYDKDGNVKAVGAKAIQESTRMEAMEAEWYKAEWFKLHLRSKYTSDKYVGHRVPHLPPNKTVTDVFADYLRYLFNCAESYIKESHFNGRDLWTSTGNDLLFVLCHPNGWEGKEQSQMRKAAVQAGLIPDTQSGHSRITFVSEGEASLHFAIENCAITKTDEGQGIILVDAGGGTIDISSYERIPSEKTSFQEVSMARSYFKGSTFVTFTAMDFLSDLLANSSFEDDFDDICECFDATTKIRFRDASVPQYVKFGTKKDTDLRVGIRLGHLKLAGADVAKFFQPSVDCIVQAVLDQQKTAHGKITHVIMVGGFAASDYLVEQISMLLKGHGLTLVRPDNRPGKAASDGAVSFFLDHHVRTRVAKVSYGTSVSVTYDSQDKEHVERQDSCFVGVDGRRHVRGSFDVLLAKNTQISETKEFRSSYHLRSSSPDFQNDEEVVLCYRGSKDNPRWIDTDPENFMPICTVNIDSSQIPSIKKKAGTGDVYYLLQYDLVLIFGLTELQAQVSWLKDGVERRSPAQMVYG